MSAHRHRSWKQVVAEALPLLLVQVAWWLITSIGHHFTVVLR